METYYRHITINDTTEKGSECQYELFVAVTPNDSHSKLCTRVEAYSRYSSSPKVHYEGRWLVHYSDIVSVVESVVLPRRKISYESINEMTGTEYNFITDPKNTIQ